MESQQLQCKDLATLAIILGTKTKQNHNKKQRNASLLYPFRSQWHMQSFGKSSILRIHLFYMKELQREKEIERPFFCCFTPQVATRSCTGLKPGDSLGQTGGSRGPKTRSSCYFPGHKQGTALEMEQLHMSWSPYGMLGPRVDD